uniref:Micro-fibrillar-associated protein 1 C-terminal domain-containing protein n=1 Tax=Dunaliella tertiolecta TaxID=3047 RepID=A0A7S3QP77_DUNTE|mmetsp:Transcript_20137/g.56067  ORF Transcript_20137/g.56067 Transcript_20137/m.56067 type:complete len:458 (-) Transcript_20137:534-1907(-)|eukprot:CAMPEP_0202384058 /NCGR_PEP_ID=MMETSP1127-20130417/52928_1 /ASSEMBLY_ACC=CAM_ASM_000462 /TAXON_ID=3047 /ORGANISM="Dunaliella tertiolecta, Strain CCMP1320" /LENGTH=457 /DNA_ID=CAMNT_0048983727 /DNA_START=102 /DNA_END=1475 /DNA_ORIENTATION=+
MHRHGALAARRRDDEEADKKGRVEATKVRRYWAGKAPDWATQEQQHLQDLSLAESRGETVRTEVAAPVVVQRKADPRLARLAASKNEDVEEVRNRHREIRAAEIVRRRAEEEARGEAPRPDSEEEGDDDVGGKQDQQRREGVPEEDEAEADQRRQAVRERLIQQQKANEAALQQQQNEDEEEEEEEESEYETDSEDEAYAGRRLLKPVFVPKESRETIAERERLEREEQEAELREKQRQEERKAETRQIVAEHLAAEAQAARQVPDELQRNGAELEEVNTDDEEDQVEAFEQWKVRELSRIGRDREEREKQAAAAQERERLKHMTEEERREWERANPKIEKPKQKEKWSYLQKYWHKGAFFQEAEDDPRGTTGRDAIFDRDYSAPTGEDKFNKEILPKVMQVRNFGRSGRTKWTHLLEEDTTNYDDQAIKALSEKRRATGAPGGAKEEFSKPKKFRT